MSSQITRPSATSKGIAAFGALGGKSSDDRVSSEVTTRVSAILAPDSLTAMQKRASANPTTTMKAGQEEKEPPKRPSSITERRKQKSFDGIDVKRPSYKVDINTVGEMANEVTNILGANVLGSLKTSCDGRKEEERKQQEKSAAGGGSKKSSLLTPEMMEAMQRAKIDKSRVSVAPQGKKVLVTDESLDEDSGDGGVEDEEGVVSERKERSRRRIKDSGKSTTVPQAKTSGGDDHHHHHRHHHHGQGKKKPIARSRSAGDGSDNTPKRNSRGASSPTRQRPSGSKREGRHTRKHQQDFANHAEDVGIDLDDGVPCDLDEFDKDVSEENVRTRKSHPGTRQRRGPRKTHSTNKSHPGGGGGSGGATPGRRGRNGRRGGGTRMGDVKRDQIKNMTSVEHKQFREEDYVVPESEEEPVSEGDAGASSEEEEEEGFHQVMANNVVATANMMFRGVGVAADATSSAGAAVVDGGGMLFGALGTAATYTANTAATAATYTATTAATAATYTATSATSAASGAANTLIGTGRSTRSVDEYSSDEEDQPAMNNSTGDATWGFTGGGLAPQINAKK